MKDTKFTPGPWSVCSDDPNVVVPYPTPAPFRHFTASEFIDCNTNANAHLISAAPDMYEVLDAVEAIRAAIINDEMSDLEFGHLQSCLAKHARALLALTPQIKAARAKARGEA